MEMYKRLEAPPPYGHVYIINGRSLTAKATGRVVFPIVVQPE